MKFNTLAKLLLEMPVRNVSKLGDDEEWEKRGAYDKKSHVLLTDPKFESKLKKAFSKSDPDLNFYFINRKELVEDLGDVPGYETQERGRIDESDPLWDLIGVDYEEVRDPRGITIIFNGNYGADLVELTPWIIGHRMSHAFQSSIRGVKKFVSMETAYEYLTDGVKLIITELSEYYGLDKIIGRLGKDWFYNSDTLPYVNSILNSIGTFASARNGKIDRPFEFIHELVAQYLITGNIRLRDDFPPLKIVNEKEKRYYPKGQEFEDEYTRYYRYRQLDGYDFKPEGHATSLEYYIQDVFSAAYGSVFLM